jgi:hypothetical protein
MVGPLENAVGARSSVSYAVSNMFGVHMRTLWAIDHEGIREPVDQHAEIARDLLAPDILDIDAIFVLEAHLS